MDRRWINLVGALALVSTAACDADDQRTFEGAAPDEGCVGSKCDAVQDEEPDAADDGGEIEGPAVYQARYQSSARYEFGIDVAPPIPIVGAPDDTDWDNWAMLHDDDKYRLYFMRAGREDALYQFVFNEDDWSYEYGHGTGVNDEIPIEGAPDYADMSSIAMLHDGDTYRLYAQAWDEPARVVQFGYDESERAYVYLGLDHEIPITGTPNLADWDGWAMLHDGDAYRLYAYGDHDADQVVQHGYNPANHRYEYGHDSQEKINIVDRPQTACSDDYAMLHDGERYRMYVVDPGHH